MKSLQPVETQAFLQFAPAYFAIMAETLFHELPSVIAKMLGFFQVVIKNPVTGTEIKLDLLVMENLFYDRVETRKFDLKGSMRNRKIQSTGEQNEVLLDENMVEYIYESPLFAREHSKKLLRASVSIPAPPFTTPDLPPTGRHKTNQDLSTRCGTTRSSLRGRTSWTTR